MIIIGAYSYFCYSRLLYTIEKAGSYLMIQRPRGTSDFLHMDNPLWAFVESSASALAHLYGYSRIDTPTFESADLFVRTIGDSTDIVQKEMYTFEDKGGGLLTLRAEGTAPVCRAFLEHGLHNRSLPLRLYYLCPVFRYERPQSGRYREHHQFGVELLGAEGPEADAEVIALACDLVKKLGLEDIELFVNSIGDPACRSEYLVLLRYCFVIFFNPGLTKKLALILDLGINLKYSNHILEIPPCFSFSIYIKSYNKFIIEIFEGEIEI